MMEKIIDIDYTSYPVSPITLLGDARSLEKTAGVIGNDIWNKWDSIQSNPKKAYILVIGVAPVEYFGCNKNGDGFSSDTLIESHPTFVSNANVFLEHANRDVARSIGKPIFSSFNEVGKRVELILELDKFNPLARETITKIERNEPLFVSMGCSIQYDVCSICGNKAKVSLDHCDHIRKQRGKILQDGRLVYMDNIQPKFFDISIVAKPAEPLAFTLGTKLASFNTDRVAGIIDIDVSDLGLLRKLGMMLKKIDLGEGIVGMKGADDTLIDTKYPVIVSPTIPELEDNDVSPGEIIDSVEALDGNFSLDEAIYISLKESGIPLTEDSVEAIILALPEILNKIKDTSILEEIMQFLIKKSEGYKTSRYLDIIKARVTQLQDLKKVATSLLGSRDLSPESGIFFPEEDSLQSLQGDPIGQAALVLLSLLGSKDPGSILPATIINQQNNIRRLYGRKIDNGRSY